MNIKSFNTALLQAQYLASEVAKKLAQAISAKGKAVLCVPGGSTPDLFFNELSQKDLDWDKVHVVLNDERWVPLNDPLSNEAMLREKFLINNAKGAKILNFYRDNDDLDTALADLAEELEALLPLDVCVLGMGEDGHTASLFPNGDNLARALKVPSDDIVLPVKVADKKELRVTLTLSALLSADAHYLLIKGIQKKHIADLAIQAKNDELPVSYVFDHTDLQVVFTEA